MNIINIKHTSVNNVHQMMHVYDDFDLFFGV